MAYRNPAIFKFRKAQEAVEEGGTRLLWGCSASEGGEEMGFLCLWRD